MKSNAVGITTPDFKLCYKATATKTAWYWHKNRHGPQTHGVEDPDISSHSCTHLSFDKGTIAGKTATSTNIRKSESMCRRLKLDPHLSPCKKPTQKWIKGLKIGPETLKL
jgi:hypothetical protein